MLKVYIGLILCLVIFVGCSGNVADDRKEEDLVIRISDIFPFNENIFYEYHGQGTHLAAWDIFIDHIRGNRIQRRIIAGDMVVAEVLENTEGALILIYSEPNFFRHEDLTQREPNTGAVILREPIELGARWYVAQNEIAEITNMNASIETSYGRFTSAIEVTHTMEDSTVINYYVKGLGHVKSITQARGMEFITELSRIEEDARFERSFYVYVYGENGEFLETEERTVLIGTNANIIEILNAELRRPLQQTGVALLGENARINSIDFGSDIITIDVSREYVTDAVWQNELEEKIMLQSLISTLKRFYFVEEAMITVEGNAYEGRYVMLELGQPLQHMLNIHVEVETYDE